MKRLIPLTLLISCLPNQLFSNVDNSEIPLGIEAVTGFRSEYVQRGFTLGDDVLDFQIETELALNDYTFFSIGAWYATETGRGDFNEASFSTKLSFQKSDELSIGLSAAYRNTSNTFFESGADLGIFGTYTLNKSFSATSGVYYDFGADGLYANLETNWSHVLSDDAFISLKTGVSFVSDYYGRDGINDLYARLSLTYHVSNTVSLTPFIGTSILIDDDSNVPGVINDDSFYAGIWFVVRF